MYSIITCITSLHVQHHYMYIIITCITGTSLHVQHHYLYNIITCITSLHVQHHYLYNIITCTASLHVHHHYLYNRNIITSTSLSLSKIAGVLNIARLDGSRCAMACNVFFTALNGIKSVGTIRRMLYSFL